MSNWNPTTQQWEDSNPRDGIIERPSPDFDRPSPDAPDSRTVTTPSPDFTVTQTGTETEDDGPFYCVDVNTGTVYHGTIHQDLTDRYEETRKSAVPRSLYIDNRPPILARAVVRLDDQTNQQVTTWYPVNLDDLPQGPVPGEYKMVHLTREV